MAFLERATSLAFYVSRQIAQWTHASTTTSTTPSTPDTATVTGDSGANPTRTQTSHIFTARYETHP